MICLQQTLQSRVKSILHGVICPAGQLAGNVTPSVAAGGMELQNQVVFLLCPSVLLHVWAEVVLPALSALFADAAGQEARDLVPVAWSKDRYLLGENAIFLFGPRSR